jgi:glycerol-3-phosphate dehydrogenase subunit C
MTLKEEYETILNLPGASRLKDHVFEICQFLLQLYEEGKLNTKFKEVRETYYYHVPCHLRALKIGLPALELLSLVPGLKIIELPEGCCGLAGSYGYKREKYAIAQEVGEDLFQAIRESKTRTVISDCEACRLQIGYHTGVKTLHTVQVLRQAYGA